jgi:hypothetical protein
MNPYFATFIFLSVVWGGACWLRLEALKPEPKEDE